ncbi:NUDIX hydrolase [Eubacterium sp. 1001713B170207_170306_E7]|uniref:NUDIX hydrolase n=1 Tax=Eubacterium sp. 1001713B170207_170306_E7 TaxID=2787097 RepID=UPI001899DA59|nr:NUDIX hydrolase [Eubacterium sp. 1001713B170207_170306_E7]
MDFKTLYRQIFDFIPTTDQEFADKKIFVSLIEKYPDTILTRKNPVAHLTSSGFVFNGQHDQCLMVFHNLYQSWSWSGGHADGCADLLSVAVREATEETGIKNLKPLSEKIISLDVLPVFGHIKNGRYVSAHLHLSVAFSLIADDRLPLTIKPDENSAVAWIPLASLEKYSREDHMLPIYQKIIKRTKAL